ncbi:MAG TPA: hypothetical protein VGG19_08115 [Tepidisphaeraceae bacterium]|jgi:hypothetical protein
MSETPAGIIACPACGRQFKWKPELAGKQAKCACGHLIAIPPTPPQDDLYDLAEPEPAQSLPRVPKPLESLNPKPVVNYQAPKKAGDGFSTEKLRNVQAPLALIAIGVIVQWVAAWLRSSHTSVALSATLILVSVGMVISTVFMLIAVFIAARIRQIHLGKFWSAVLKLAAISVAPRAIVLLLYPVLMFVPFFGWLIGWAIEFCLFFALLGYFCELDESDTWFFVIVMIVVSIALTVGMGIIAARFL